MGNTGLYLSAHQLSARALGQTSIQPLWTQGMTGGEGKGPQVGWFTWAAQGLGILFLNLNYLYYHQGENRKLWFICPLNTIWQGKHTDQNTGVDDLHSQT